MNINQDPFHSFCELKINYKRALYTYKVWLISNVYLHIFQDY